MSDTKARTMRDALIEQLYRRMHDDDRVFFVSADFGAPALDKLRRDFGDRFLNVGIAEQNLINVSTGLALEGFTVYAYAIAAFLTMRAYEQIRTNLALLSQHRPINVNLVGVGAGVSYDMSGPSHHCLEDIALMRVLPNIVVCSPSDWLTAERFVDFSLDLKKPKYIRLDGKPLPLIYDEDIDFEWEKGFCELQKGDDICLVSTGYATHRVLKVAAELRQRYRLGVLDVFLLRPIDEDSLFEVLKEYRNVLVVEEAFTHKGGLDSVISNVINSRDSNIGLWSLGFEDSYVFNPGNRDFLAGVSHFGFEDIIRLVEQIVAGSAQVTGNGERKDTDLN